MTVLEKVNYLKGLIDGMNLDESDEVTKVIKVMTDVMEQMALELDAVGQDLDDTMELVDEIDDDLADVEDFLSDDYDEEDEEEFEEMDLPCSGCTGCGEVDDGSIYEFTCPSCGGTVYVDEDTIDLGAIPCPNCGKEVEFDQDFLFEEDEKDGDITDKMVIESISKFVDKKKHICNVTYAVANSKGAVSKATRKVQFTDYRKPHFVLKEPLCFKIGSDTDVKSKIGATDVFDGDISNKVKILSKDMSTTMTGQYAITAQVTNSLGDTVTLKTIATIEQENNFSPTITLKKNIVYIKVGAKFNPKDYIESAKDGDGKTLSIGSIKVASSSVKTKKQVVIRLNTR